MSARPELKLVRGAKNRLPVAWDGKQVAWAQASDAWHSPHFPTPRCYACKAQLPAYTRFIGTVARTGTQIVAKPKTTRSGRRYEKQVEVPATPEKRLFLEECNDCANQTVYDMKTDELWELDETDYLPDGSWPTQPELNFEQEPTP